MFMKWLVAGESRKDSLIPLALFPIETDAKQYVEMLQQFDYLNHHYVIKEVASEEAMLDERYEHGKEN